MKKILAVVLTMVGMCMFTVVSFAGSTTKTEQVSVDVKVDYKVQEGKRSSEHVLKNTIKLTDNNWQLVGKDIAEKKHSVMLVLAKLLAYSNNEYTIQFLLIDSGHNNLYISDPQIKVLAGLPASLSVNEDTHKIDLSVLAVAAN